MGRLLLVLSLVVFLPVPVLACSCGGSWSIEAAYANAERVAVVRVTKGVLRESDRESPEIHASGNVKEQLKGRRVQRVKIIALPPSNGCFEPLQIGESYVVFWHGSTAWHTACNPQVRVDSIPASTLQGWRGAP